MYYAQECPVCGSKNLIRRPASLAPFIRDYVFDGNEASLEACCCQDCRMIFSSLRFDGEEVRRLYSDYRGAHYASVREKVEPWYKGINNLIGNNPVEVASRHRFMGRIMAKGNVNPSTILDWGGDRGTFVPPGMRNARVFVYDVSCAKPLPGMTSISQDDAAAPYDLVVCTHVMEHVSEPYAIASRLRQLTTPGGHIYFEVPMDMGFAAYRSSLFNRSLNIGLPWYFHEHINHYSQMPFVRLLERTRLELICYRLSLIDVGWTRIPIIGCLARRPLHEGPVSTGDAPAGWELTAYFSIMVRKRLREKLRWIFLKR